MAHLLHIQWGLDLGDILLDVAFQTLDVYRLSDGTRHLAMAGC